MADQIYEYTMFIDMEQVRGFECSQSPEEMKDIIDRRPEELFRIIGSIMERMFVEKEVDIKNVIIVAGDVEREEDGEEVAARNSLMYMMNNIIDKRGPAVHHLDDVK